MLAASHSPPVCLRSCARAGCSPAPAASRGRAMLPTTPTARTTPLSVASAAAAGHSQCTTRTRRARRRMLRLPALPQPPASWIPTPNRTWPRGGKPGVAYRPLTSCVCGCGCVCVSWSETQAPTRKAPAPRAPCNPPSLAGARTRRRSASADVARATTPATKASNTLAQHRT